MNGLVDLHCHLLPGLDDGAKTEADTVDILRAFVAEGVSMVNATPHYNSTYHNLPDIIFQKVTQINQAAARQHLPIEVFPSQEVRIFGDLLDKYQAGELLTVANRTNYMMIEFATQDVPHYAYHLFYQMRLEGLMPVIVHPERNQDFQKNPDKLFELVEQGGLTQVTAASVTGHFGKKVEKFTDQLFEARLVHTIASDAHNITNRASMMGRAFTEIGDFMGQSFAKQLNANAEAIINNQAVYPDSPRRIKQKKLFGLFG